MRISRGGFDFRNHTIVEVHTDEGITGLGEGVGNAHLVKAILEGQMGNLALGLDPFNIEKVRNTLIDSQVYFERMGSAICAASAIEMACWDIKGKAYGVPVYDLVGGKTRDKVKVYANGWFENISLSSPSISIIPNLHSLSYIFNISRKIESDIVCFRLKEDGLSS